MTSTGQYAPPRGDQEIREHHRVGGDTRAPGLRVLVADDDPVVQGTLERAMQLLGYECRVARDGSEAWSLHRAEPADVIVSALRLPSIDGRQLCHMTRAEDDGSAYTHFILTLTQDEAARFIATESDADDCLVKPVDLGALQRRLASVARMRAVLDNLAVENTALRRDSQTSFLLARVDSLTGVGNRLRMDEDIAVVWAQAKRYARPYVAALCDIDWFKSYNDTNGHLAGDEVLRRVAHAIRAGLRRGDILYRYGGEEFLVLLPEQSTAEASAAMDRVRRAVELLAIATPAGQGVITISVGVAAILAIDEHPEEWIGRTDDALYSAKSKGRNRVEVDASAVVQLP